MICESPGGQQTVALNCCTWRTLRRTGCRRPNRLHACALQDVLRRAGVVAMTEVRYRQRWRSLKRSRAARKLLIRLVICHSQQPWARSRERDMQPDGMSGCGCRTTGHEGRRAVLCFCKPARSQIGDYRHGCPWTRAIIALCAAWLAVNAWHIMMDTQRTCGQRHAHCRAERLRLSLDKRFHVQVASESI